MMMFCMKYYNSCFEKVINDIIAKCLLRVVYLYGR